MKVKPKLFLLMGALLAMVLPSAVRALPYGAGTFGTCTYGSCAISISSDGTVSLSVTPTAAGVYTTQSDSVDVTTGASTGFTLTLNDSDTNTNLTDGSDNFGASSGTQASPVTRSMNTWGYRVDGLSGFGAGPTSTETNASSSSYTFAGVPASNQTTHTIRVYNSAANPAVTTTVWYGVAANLTNPNGSYSTTVTYTATAN